MKAIGKRIEKAREYRDMSRTELGKAVGFPEDSAYRRVLSYEKGDRVPKEDTLKLFAKALKIDYDWFMFDDDIQMGNIRNFEKGTDATKKEYIKLRMKAEKAIYDNLQVLTINEINEIIAMIKNHEGDIKISWNNPAYDARKNRMNKLMAALNMMAEQEEQLKNADE
jgi:transcriptional regulator with XRE-family HTH domain